MTDCDYSSSGTTKSPALILLVSMTSSTAGKSSSVVEPSLLELVESSKSSSLSSRSDLGTSRFLIDFPGARCNLFVLFYTGAAASVDGDSVIFSIFCSTDPSNAVQKTFRFSDVFKGYRKATPGCNGLKGHKLDLWNPLTRVSLEAPFSCNLSTKDFKSLLNSSFGRALLCERPLDGFFQSSNNFLHNVFKGANQATSRDWRRWVTLGKRHKKAMSCFEHASITDWHRCDDKLLPIRTFFPSCLPKFGSIRIKNQSAKVVSSAHQFHQFQNHQLFDLLYLAPGRPHWTHCW